MNKKSSAEMKKIKPSSWQKVTGELDTVDGVREDVILRKWHHLFFDLTEEKELVTGMLGAEWWQNIPGKRNNPCKNPVEWKQIWQLWGQQEGRCN